MVRSSKEILESHDFKTNVLYVNVGSIEAGQLSHVVTEEEKRNTQVLQEMKEDCYNLVRRKKSSY